MGLKRQNMKHKRAFRNSFTSFVSVCLTWDDVPMCPCQYWISCLGLLILLSESRESWQLQLLLGWWFCIVGELVNILVLPV